MASVVVKVPQYRNRDYDFIAFSYNNKHSYEDFGIYRVSNGDRYDSSLMPTMQDKTAEVPGGDGKYYFGTTYGPREIPVNFAFDRLTEEKRVQLRQWLNGDGIHPLWFAEAPNRVYMAKVSGNSSFKFIPFEENGERIYKGEGSVTFTAFYPFARTPDYVEHNGIRMEGNHYNSYALFSNYEEIKKTLPLQVKRVGETAAEDLAYGERPFHIVAKLLSPAGYSDAADATNDEVIIVVKAGGVEYTVSGAGGQTCENSNGEFTVTLSS